MSQLEKENEASSWFNILHDYFVSQELREALKDSRRTAAEEFQMKRRSLSSEDSRIEVRFNWACVTGPQL